MNRRVVLSGSQTATPSPLGVIFTNDGTSISGFTNTSGNFSTDGTKITATKSGGTTFSSRLEYNVGGYSSNLENWTQTVYYDAYNKSGLGIGVGAGPSNAFCALLFLTAVPGQIGFFRTDTGADLGYSGAGTAITINNNDIIKLVLTDTNGTFSMTATNMNNSQSVSFSYTYGLTNPVTLTQPINFKPTLFALGGTQYVTSWIYESSALCGLDYMLIGDSISAGFFAGTAANRYGVLASALANKSYIIYSGPGNSSGSYNSYLTEIIALRPKKAIIVLGANDLLNSVALATSMANLTTLKNTLEAAGIQVIFGKIPPVNGKTANNYNVGVGGLVSTFGSQVGFDLYTFSASALDTFNPIYSPDGLHGNSTWQSLAATELATVL